MKALVVGTVPPPGGEAARALALVAAGLVDEGYEVEVLAPDPRSAAHRHARLGGPRLALRLALASPGCSRLVLRIQPGLPLSPEAGRGARALTLALLGLALRRYGQVSLYLDSPVPIPGGLGGRATALLWGSASEVVVGNEEDRRNLLPAPGISPERVRLAEPATPRRAPAAGWSVEHEGDPRAEVLTLVRARAAERRRLEQAGDRLAAADPLAGGMSPLEAAGEVRVSAWAAARLASRKALRLARR